MLERALVNLLRNAVHYSDGDSSVKLCLRAEEKEIHCCVEDQGKGIGEEDLKRVFDPFHRVQKAHSETMKQRGTGLGLAFVKVVAVKHQGSIDVESSLGRGSRFCLKIPWSGC
jgi:signal transduction histidine kinase